MDLCGSTATDQQLRKIKVGKTLARLIMRERGVRANAISRDTWMHFMSGSQHLCRLRFSRVTDITPSPLHGLHHWGWQGCILVTTTRGGYSAVESLKMCDGSCEELELRRIPPGLSRTMSWLYRRTWLYLMLLSTKSQSHCSALDYFSVALERFLLTSVAPFTCSKLNTRLCNLLT